MRDDHKLKRNLYTCLKGILMYSIKNMVEQGIGQVLLSSLINYIIIGSLKFTSCIKLPLDNCTVISFNIILSNCMYIGNWHIVVSTKLKYCIGYNNIIIIPVSLYTCEW